MKTPPIVSRQEWEAARQQLLVKEKELTRARDGLAAERRRTRIRPGERSLATTCSPPHNARRAGGRRTRWQDPRGRRHWLARPQHRGARGLRSCCQPVDGACLYPDGARSLGGRCDRRTPLRGGWTHRRQLFAQFGVERGVRSRNRSLGATSADAHGAQRHRGGGA